MKKILSLVLVVAMMATLCVGMAFAAQTGGNEVVLNRLRVGKRDTKGVKR